MTTTPNGNQPIVEICEQIDKCQKADAIMAALAMVYVGIDTMAWLSLPIGSSSVNRSRFCDWVDTYLKTDASQPYQYIGLDVYAARCAMLHSYGSIADLHNQANPPKIFGYLDQGSHRRDGSSLVLISIGMLILDFRTAVTAFMQAALQDADLKARIDSRMNALVSTFPVVAK